MSVKVEVDDYLRLCEGANKIAFVDIEATNLKADYGSTLVVSVKPYRSNPVSLTVVQPGNDQRVVREAKELLEEFDCWVTYYGKMFDIPFLNTRLHKWKQAPIEKRLHLDLFFTQKAHFLMARKSLAHSLEFIDASEQKMSMSPNDWNAVLADPRKAMKKMVARCESDVRTLQLLYDRIKHVVGEIKR